MQWQGASAGGGDLNATPELGHLDASQPGARLACGIVARLKMLEVAGRLTVVSGIEQRHAAIEENEINARALTARAKGDFQSPFPAPR
jgi:hypothetical protein